ncbi:MAG: hypothetical protein AAGD92_06915 [Pseudomonadota bacterium]
MDVIDDWRREKDGIPSQGASIRKLAIRGVMVERFLDSIFRSSMEELEAAISSDPEKAEEIYIRWKVAAVQTLDRAALQELEARAAEKQKGPSRRDRDFG